MSFEIYTDGSLKEKWSSWAFVIVKDNKIILERAKKEKSTSSNRMEFSAAIEALKTLQLNTSATLYSDSRNLIDTMTIWKNDWKKWGWKKKYSQPIPDIDLIKELNELNEKHSITWKWVRSHAGQPFNERCDELCILARSSDLEV